MTDHCTSCGTRFEDHVGIIGTCAKLREAEILLGKIAADKLKIFATVKPNPLSEILHNHVLSGFCVKEWCDYFKEGNDQYKEDGLTILQLREDLAHVAVMLRELLIASRSE